MARFDIYRNENPATCIRFPYVLDIQAELLSELPTRLVVPLRAGTGTEPWIVSRLHPILKLGDNTFIAGFSEMAAVPSNILGNNVGTAQAQREDLIAAIDLVVTGF